MNNLKQHIDVYVGDISRLKNDSAKCEEYLSGLSEYRRNKCLRYKNDTASVLSIGAGQLLKTALSKYGINEMFAEYGFSENGKPYILHYPMIEFNISHSHDKVMCVISPDGIKLGCDIESVKSGKLKVAKRFFTKSENDMLDSRSDEKKKDALFSELWTLKESFIKCTGEGLGRSMDSFEFYKDNGNFNIKTFDSDKNDFVRNERLYFETYDNIEGYYYSLCYFKSSVLSRPNIDLYNLIL